MKTILLTAVLVLVTGTAAQAQYYNGYSYGNDNYRQNYGTYQGRNGYRSNVNYNQYGNNGYGTVRDNRGNQLDHSRQRVGNTTFDNYRFNNGRSINCTTMTIGNIVNRNCY
ncbi:hypothetical protein H6G45_15105 [Synechocystis sp. FACHB-383]|uniref:hypothetical protein n=1 Tax=Synechocystis sp. FACHB-383 TaxID=2692864 RepID=UPI0016833CA4|nr:hypothetical protein [Synechocystis sp. FACHB-383]MBD2654787.1 hypothetical protein [Synechocystis sp. FACHB-383]